MKLNTLIKTIALALLMVACSSGLKKLTPPIILAAESQERDIVLKDTTGRHVAVPGTAPFARSISDSYQPGDTIATIIR